MAKKSFLLEGQPPQTESFDGFPKEAFTFLHNLQKNNNKEWFESHRAEYEEHLREPSKAFILAVGGEIAKEGLPIIADLKRSLFRINRDIRFSKDKSPYKTHIGYFFPMAETGKDEWCGMYIGMEPEGKNGMKIYAGGGVHQPMPPQLKAIREKIARDHKTLDTLLKAKSFASEFDSGLRGDKLTRPPKGFDEDHPAIETLKLKSFDFGYPMKKEDLMNDKLVPMTIRKMKAALPVLEYLAKR